MRDPSETTRFAYPTAPLSPPKPSIDQESQANTQLLISIRNTDEARIVRAAGVDWIDLKEPRAGALGRSSLADAAAVAATLHDHPQRSAALGELLDLEEQVAFDFARHFPVLKVGLSRAHEHAISGNWQTRFESLAAKLRARGSELIPVAYADASTCGAPDLQEVLRVAQQIEASHMLIDTFVKDGRGLLHWLSLKELQQTIEESRSFGCGIVLAGSLKFIEAPDLLALNPAAIAVRGAVCSSVASTDSDSFNQARATPIDPHKVKLWRNLVTSTQ